MRGLDRSDRLFGDKLWPEKFSKGKMYTNKTAKTCVNDLPKVGGAPIRSRNSASSWKELGALLGLIGQTGVVRNINSAEPFFFAALHDSPNPLLKEKKKLRRLLHVRSPR